MQAITQSTLKNLKSICFLGCVLLYILSSLHKEHREELFHFGWFVLCLLRTFFFFFLASEDTPNIQHNRQIYILRSQNLSILPGEAVCQGFKLLGGSKFFYPFLYSHSFIMSISHRLTAGLALRLQGPADGYLLAFMGLTA